MRRLGIAYVALFGLCLAGLGMLVWRAQLFIALAQRSNVETLTLAFMMIFFAYLATLSAPGAWGAAQIIRHQLGGDWADQQRRKMRGLGQSSGRPTVADLNVLVERADQPSLPFDLVVADSVGRMGRLRVDGRDWPMSPNIAMGPTRSWHSSNARFPSCSSDAASSRTWRLSRGRKSTTRMQSAITAWSSSLEIWNAAWPKATCGPRLSETDCEELETALSAVCPALRDEGFLPHWDFQAEHKLPIIPEPLGLISLSRSEQRVEPVSSMGCAVLVVIGLLGILVLFAIAPPWVPGT